MRTTSHAFIALGVFLSGCRGSPEEIANGPDPMRALAQHVESSRYGPDYWKDVANSDPLLWTKATAFCGRLDAEEYPTCASVRMAEFFVGNTKPGASSDSFSFRTDQKPDSRDVAL